MILCPHCEYNILVPDSHTMIINRVEVLVITCNRCRKVIGVVNKS